MLYLFKINILFYYISNREQLEQLQTERGQLSELGDKLRAANDLTEQLLDDKVRYLSCDNTSKVERVER